jgi:hypothetical protein
VLECAAQRSAGARLLGVGTQRAHACGEAGLNSKRLQGRFAARRVYISCGCGISFWAEMGPEQSRGARVALQVGVCGLSMRSVTHCVRFRLNVSAFLPFWCPGRGNHQGFCAPTFTNLQAAIRVSVPIPFWAWLLLRRRTFFL